VNLLHKSMDQGALADIQSTAGSMAYISPGLTVGLSAKLHAFAFMQFPVYSNLYGYQLFPRYTASAGATYAFKSGGEAPLFELLQVRDDVSAALGIIDLEVHLGA
jgi:hypothetical protein